MAKQPKEPVANDAPVDAEKAQADKQAEADAASQAALEPQATNSITASEVQQQKEQKAPEQQLTVAQWQQFSGQPAHYVQAFLQWAQNEEPNKQQSAQAWHAAHEEFRKQAV